MTVHTGARFGLSWGFAPGDSGWGASFNLQSALLEAMLSLVLLSDSTVAPPASPAEDDAYFVPAGATGNWIGRSGHVAAWQGGAWNYYTIPTYMRARIIDRNGFFFYNGAAWVSEVSITAGVTSVAGQTGTVTLSVGDVSGAAPLSSPGFLGSPTAPNQTALSRNQLIANTKYVDDAITSLGTYATHSYVDTRITNLINGAPTAFDTLKEISDQLATDESAASALTTLVGTKVAYAGGTMTGVLNLFAGSTVSTPAGTDNSTNVTNTSWVRSYVASLGLATTNSGAFKAAGVVETWATLPTEAQNLPIPMFISGKPTASQSINIVMAQATTIPANLAGTLAYQGTQATANMVFTVNKISGGASTGIGTITLGSASKTAITLSTQAQVTLAAGDVLQFIAPSTQDTTGADIGITLLAMKV